MTSDIIKNPTREGLDMEVKGLDPNRPLPIPPPEVERMWDSKKAVPPQYMAAPWRNYSQRYLSVDQTSVFDRFFGSQEKTAPAPALHPCHDAAAKVHACIARNADKHERRSDFCRSIINVFEGCLREYNM
jgi:hypothetical protein